jgi:hypothetical protein
MYRFAFFAVWREGPRVCSNDYFAITAGMAATAAANHRDFFVWTMVRTLCGVTALGRCLAGKSFGPRAPTDTAYEPCPRVWTARE